MSLSVSRKTCYVASEQKLAGAQTFRHARLRMRRRDRRRQATIDDIKDTARSQLADAGPAGISMRAIARHLAIMASAVHYYFPSHQALLDALVVDGFTSLAEALRTTYERAAPRPPSEQWLAVCQAHRAWALDHQTEYLLLYGHDGLRRQAAKPPGRSSLLKCRQRPVLDHAEGCRRR
jgi:AcrR family transcriptional regulator